MYEVAERVSQTTENWIVGGIFIAMIAIIFPIVFLYYRNKPRHEEDNKNRDIYIAVGEAANDQARVNRQTRNYLEAEAEFHRTGVVPKNAWRR